MNDYKDLGAFLDASPVNFLAVETVRTHLEDAGFVRLSMRDEWNLAAVNIT